MAAAHLHRVLKEVFGLESFRPAQEDVVRAALTKRSTLAIELSKNYDARKDRGREKLDNMIAYAQSARCRWRLILRQFGETIGGEACRDRDNCRNAGSREPLAAAS